MDIKKRLTALLSVKSIVTLMLTMVVGYLAVTGQMDQEFLKNVFFMIIAFYYGTQTEKANQMNQTEGK